MEAVLTYTTSDEPFQYAANVMGEPSVVYSNNANILVSTIDKTIFDSKLTQEQRDGKKGLPNVIERQREWFITNYNGFPISISLFVPKENIQPIINTLDYVEGDEYYIFNYIIQGKMEDKDPKLVNVCKTVMNDLYKQWSDKWKWRSVPVDYSGDITHPLFSVSNEINYIPSTYLNEIVDLTPLSFIYKHIYKPNKFNGKFIYSIQLKTNILKQYHRCLIPEICSLDDHKIILSGSDTKEFNLDHHNDDYLFKNKKYTFTMEIKRVYYQDNHGNKTRLDMIPLSKMKIEFKDNFNILTLAYIYKTKHLTSCVPFDSAFNDKFFDCKDFPFVSCPHYIKYDLNKTTPEGKKNRAILIDKTKLALKQYKKLHNRITHFLRFYNSVEILKFAKNFKKVKTIQKQLLTASIDLSQERTAFNTDSKDPTVTCGICLENLVKSDDDDDDDDTSKIYILSKCKHAFHLDCIISMNNSIRDSYNEPGEIWDYESLKHHFQCPYCRTELSSIDIITSTSKGMGILL